MAQGRIVIAGGAGFLGRILCPWLAGRGWEVVVLTRQPRQDAGAIRAVPWDGRTIGDWATELDGAAGLINLAGRSVNCRYHARNRREIMDSRVRSTRVLGECIGKSAAPPPVWLNASTATIYKHTYDRPMDEATGQIGATPAAKDAFSIDVAKAWEQTFEQAATPRTRKVAMRTAMVFGIGPGGVFRVLRRLARFGLGGRMAGGRQFVSWIHQEDFCRAVQWLLGHDELSGPVNLAAPNPVTNREMMRQLRRACGMPFGLPAARWMLEVGTFFLRTETELVIKSRRVVPGRLVASGFEFRFPDIAGALTDLVRRPDV